MKIQTNHILNIVIFILMLSFLNVLVGQEIHQRPVEGFRVYQIYFVGNTGAGSSDKLESTLKLLRKKLEIAGSRMKPGSFSLDRVLEELQEGQPK